MVTPLYHLVFSECLEMLSPRVCGGRDEGDRVRLEPDHPEDLADVFLDLVIPGLVVLDGVHLVDRHDQLVDAECLGKEDVLLGLLHDTIRCRNDEDSCISLRCTGDHVLDEVPVARAVHYGKVELIRVEPAVGDIYRDASLTLFLQRVHDPGELESRLSLGLSLLPVLVDNVRRYGAGLEQQPPDKGRLAVVDVTDDC